MPKRGLKHGNNSGIETAIAYIHGRIEIQIEQFAASIGVQSAFLAERLAALLSPEGAGHFYHVSVLRSETPARSGSVEPLALAVNSHISETPSTIVGTTSEDSTNKVTRKSKITSQEMIAKLKKRKDPMAKRILKGMLAKKKKTNPKQQVYAARSLARKKGLPLPPLPGKAA